MTNSNGFGAPRNFRQRRFPRMREYNTLLRVAEPIPDEVLYGPAGPNGERVDRWLAGIEFDPIAIGNLECYGAQCDTEDGGISGLGDVDQASDGQTFLPVEIRTSETCSTIGLDAAEFRDRLEARLLAKDSALLTSLILGRGDDDADNPCWDNPTIAGSGGSPANPIGNGIYALDEAVARLEDALARDLGDVLGTIFMTPGQLGMLQNRGGLVFENGCWWTPTGTAIVADSGVTGRGLDVGGDGADNIESPFRWIYGCGPVYAHRGPVTYTPDVFASVDDETGDPRVLPRNIMTIIARRNMIAVFDPTIHYRVAAAYASSVFVG